GFEAFLAALRARGHRLDRLQMIASRHCICPRKAPSEFSTSPVVLTYLRFYFPGGPELKAPCRALSKVREADSAKVEDGLFLQLPRTSSNIRSKFGSCPIRFECPRP